MSFIFVYGVRKCSYFIPLHVVVQCSQHAVLKRLFSPLCILASFVQDTRPIGAWVYLWAFYLVPLVCISVFLPVLYCLDYCCFVVLSEVRQIDSFSSVFLSQDCFGWLGSFMFSYKSWNFLFSFFENAIGDLIGISLNPLKGYFE